MGLSFLRHLRRTRALAYVIDAAGAPSSSMHTVLAGERAARVAQRRAERAGAPPALAARLAEQAREAAAALADRGEPPLPDGPDDGVEREVDEELVDEGLLPGPGEADRAMEMAGLAAPGGPAADLAALQAEVVAYDPALTSRPALVVANKCDLPGAAENVARLRRSTALPVVEASAIRGGGAGLVAESLRFLLRDG